MTCACDPNIFQFTPALPLSPRDLSCVLNWLGDSIGQSCARRSCPVDQSAHYIHLKSFTRATSISQQVLTSLHVSGGDVGGWRSHFHRSSMVCHRLCNQVNVAPRKVLRALTLSSKTDRQQMGYQVLYWSMAPSPVPSSSPPYPSHPSRHSQSGPYIENSGFFLLAIPTAFSIASYAGFTEYPTVTLKTPKRCVRYGDSSLQQGEVENIMRQCEDRTQAQQHRINEQYEKITQKPDEIQWALGKSGCKALWSGVRAMLTWGRLQRMDHLTRATGSSFSLILL